MTPTPSQLRWTGLFLVAGILLTVGAVVLLMGSRLGKEELLLQCEVRGESVSGLSTGGKVLLRGIEIGSVTKLGFDPKDPDRILVSISVDPEAPVFQDATATMEIFGITGMKYLELVPGNPASGKVKPGTVLPSRESLTSGILKSLDTVARTSTRVLSNLETLTRKTRQDQVDSIMDDFRRTSGDLAAIARDLRQARLDTQVTAISRQVDQTIRNLDSALAASQPAQAMARIDTAAQNLSTVAKRADLMLGRSQGDIYRSLEDMRSTMRNLSDFSQTIRNNPAALIRSGERDK
ncbi:MAG TPA: MlaD family protein [Fibrobacteria bacterium]|nr:MlaD family protein [Fibrobacteria bacterium]